MEKTEKKNILVFGIGLVLILLIASFIFLKPYFKKNDENKNTYDNSALVKALKKAQKITSEDLRKKILNEKTVVIIDIRDANSYNQEHITDSINIPYPDLEKSLVALDKSKTYILVDDGLELQAAYAAGGIFEKNDFSDIFYLSGGFVAWKNKTNLTVSAGDPTSFIDQSKITYINSDELKKIIEVEANVLIIDVRERSRFEEGHIKNSISIPLNELEKERKQISFGKKVVVYDDENKLEAFQAGVRLYDVGFFDVKVLSDGLKVWKEKGFEIVK